MINGLKSIRRERATLERDRVLIGSMLEDARQSDIIDMMVDDFCESVTSEDIEDLINKIPESEEDDAQVERILKSNEDINIDAMLGIDEVDSFEIDL